jgi:hypothetical protein
MFLISILNLTKGIEIPKKKFKFAKQNRNILFLIHKTIEISKKFLVSF